MLDNSVMEVVKWFIYLVMLFFALALFLFFFETGQTTRFEGFVNTQIERHAGLTPEAVENIKEENENYYRGRYTVRIDEAGTSADVTYASDEDGYDVLDEPMQYGDVLAYEVDAEYPILFSWVDPISMTTSGEAIVQVRGAAGT